jgi:hypothetical protein
MTHGFNEIRLREESEGKIVTLVFKGKLEKEDYKRFVPQLEKIMESEDKIRMLVELKEFKGWTAGALWEDTKFGTQHFNDIERLAIVGDKKWEKAMAAFIKPFTSAIVRYFDIDDMKQAEKWIREI